MKNIIQNIKKSKFLVDFISTLSSNLSLLFIGVISSIILNRVLGPEGVGMYSILTNFALLFISFAEMGIRQSNIYFIGRKTYSLNQVLSGNMIIWIFSSLIGVSIFFFILHSKQLEISGGLFFFTSLMIPVMIAESFISGVLLGNDKIQKIASLNTLNGIIKLIIIILLVWFLKLYVLGAILALLIPSLTLFLRKFNFLRKTSEIKFKPTFDPVIIKKLIGHGLLYGIGLFLMTNQKKVPILLMAGRISEQDVGIYTAGFTFASLLYNVYNALAPIIFVRSARTNNPAQNSLQIQKLMRVIFIILILLSGILYFALELLIPLMYGKKFIDSIPITRILFIGIVFYNVFLILNMDLAGRGKPWIAIYSLIPTTLINLLSNHFLINLFGIEGAAFSTSMSMAIGAVIFVLLYSKEVKMPVWQIIKPVRSDWDFIPKLVSKAKLHDSE